MRHGGTSVDRRDRRPGTRRHRRQHTFQAAGVRLSVDGGWCVDALVGEQTREHDDLDVAVDRDDLDGLVAVLTVAGYRHDRAASSSDWNFFMVDDVGRRVDIHLFHFDIDGRHEYGSRIRQSRCKALGSSTESKWSRLRRGRCINSRPPTTRRQRSRGHSATQEVAPPVPLTPKRSPQHQGPEQQAEAHTVADGCWVQTRRYSQDLGAVSLRLDSRKLPAKHPRCLRYECPRNGDRRQAWEVGCRWGLGPRSLRSSPGRM
jgi:Aminoglycoside-2''-adenylyltransferase